MEGSVETSLQIDSNPHAFQTVVFIYTTWEFG